jgi:hypothetical protein
MNVVSNAGPLIALGKLGQLSLLLTLYGEILMPREVYHEVVINGLRLGAEDAAAVDFLVRQGHIRVVEVVLLPTLPPGRNRLMWARLRLSGLVSSKGRTGCSSTMSMRRKQPVRSDSP